MLNTKTLTMDELQTMMEALSQYVDNNNPDEFLDAGTREHEKVKVDLAQAMLDDVVAEHVSRLGL